MTKMILFDSFSTPFSCRQSSSCDDDDDDYDYDDTTCYHCSAIIIPSLPKGKEKFSPAPGLPHAECGIILTVVQWSGYFFELERKQDIEQAESQFSALAVNEHIVDFSARRTSRLNRCQNNLWGALMEVGWWGTVK